MVSYLYNLSERQVEELANDSLSVKYFLGLAVDDKVPDHSTLTVFKERLLRGGGEKVYEKLFQGDSEGGQDQRGRVWESAGGG